MRKDLLPGTPEDWFHIKATHYVNAQNIFALNRVGVFSLLYERGELGLGEIASSLGLQERVLGILMDYLVHTDVLIEKTKGDSFRFTEFGSKIAKRFSNQSNSDNPEGKIQFNFFDVRVGGYGKIWQNLISILRGELTLEKDIKRDGKYSESALIKLSTRILPKLADSLSDSRIGGNVSKVLEIGVGSTLVDSLDAEYDFTFEYFGLDRDPRVITDARRRAKDKNASKVEFFEADFFSEDWLNQKFKPTDAILFFSIHFHELMSQGRPLVLNALKNIKGYFENPVLLMIEEPRPNISAAEDLPIGKWFYSHANILIHEIYNKGRILEEQEWIDLCREAGFTLKGSTSTGFLDYNIYHFS